MYRDIHVAPNQAIDGIFGQSLDLCQYGAVPLIYMSTQDTFYIYNVHYYIYVCLLMLTYSAESTQKLTIILRGLTNRVFNKGKHI